MSDRYRVIRVGWANIVSTVMVEPLTVGAASGYAAAFCAMLLSSLSRAR